MPHDFLKLVAKEGRVKLPASGEYGVGMVFLPPDAAQRGECEKIFGKIVAEEGQKLLGWRTVPTNNVTLGETAAPPSLSCARSSSAAIRSSPMTWRSSASSTSFASAPSNAIRYSGKLTAANISTSPSLSYKTLVYKGMLHDRAGRTSIIPTWPIRRWRPRWRWSIRVSARTLSRAGTARHPYRYIAHNGEINTLRGNINWMHARQAMFESELFGDDIKKILPIINTDGSDSAMFDNCLELLVLAGRSLPHAMMMMIPGAVDQSREHERREEGVLRISSLPDGTVGRPGFDRFHRRQEDRRGARSQRPAPFALLRHQG